MNISVPRGYRVIEAQKAEEMCSFALSAFLVPQTERRATRKETQETVCVSRRARMGGSHHKRHSPELADIGQRPG